MSRSTFGVDSRNFESMSELRDEVGMLRSRRGKAGGEWGSGDCDMLPIGLIEKEYFG